jgi:hypothetical protein
VQDFKISNLTASDIPPLCTRDEYLLRKTLAATPGLSVAVVPTADTLNWFHAREDFVTSELFNRYPSSKGAVVKNDSKPLAWCIWTRIYYKEHSVLYILRLVVDDEVLQAWAQRDEGRNACEGKIAALETLFREATREASEWGSMVEVWNPDDETVEAGRRVQLGVEVQEREVESVTSLRWHGTEEELQWIANEKFGWC